MLFSEEVTRKPFFVMPYLHETKAYYFITFWWSD